MARSLMKKSFTAALRDAKTADEVVVLVEEALGLREKAAEAPAAASGSVAAAAEAEAPPAARRLWL